MQIHFKVTFSVRPALFGDGRPFSRTQICCVRCIRIGVPLATTWPHDSPPYRSNTCTSDIHTAGRRGRHLGSCHSCSLWLSLGDSSLILHTVWVSPPLAVRSKAEAFDGEFQKVPLVLLASVLTGRWQSNDNYSPHSVSLELAPAANCALSPRRKEGFLEGQKKRAER